MLMGLIDGCAQRVQNLLVHNNSERRARVRCICSIFEKGESWTELQLNPQVKVNCCTVFLKSWTSEHILMVLCMDQITIKTPNPKRRLYWCLIEFRDSRYSQSCWYFRPSCELAPLCLLSSSPPPLPCVNK
jgi:hypothetical protein